MLKGIYISHSKQFFMYDKNTKQQGIPLCNVLVCYKMGIMLFYFICILFILFVLNSAYI